MKRDSLTTHIEKFSFHPGLLVFIAIYLGTAFQSVFTNIIFHFELANNSRLKTGWTLQFIDEEAGSESFSTSQDQLVSGR